VPETITPLALSPADAARFLSLNKKTIHRLIARGKLVAKKSGPRTLVTTESLQAYFADLPAAVPAVRS
jgi:excisionase family DNA binding protein